MSESNAPAHSPLDSGSPTLSGTRSLRPRRAKETPLNLDEDQMLEQLDAALPGVDVSLFNAASSLHICAYVQRVLQQLLHSAQGQSSQVLHDTSLMWWRASREC